MRSERKAKEEASTADQAKNWRDEALKSGRAKLEKRAPEAPAPGPTPPQKKAKTAAKPAAQQEVPLSNVNFGGKAAKAGKKLSKAQLLAKAEAKQGQQSTEVGWKSSVVVVPWLWSVSWWVWSCRLYARGDTIFPIPARAGGMEDRKCEGSRRKGV